MIGDNTKYIVDWAESIKEKCNDIINDPKYPCNVRTCTFNSGNYMYGTVCSIEVEFTDGTTISGPMPYRKTTYNDLCKELKTGDPCLVRYDDGCDWMVAIFDRFVDSEYFAKICEGSKWDQCIPYEGYREYFNTKNSPLEYK